MPSDAIPPSITIAAGQQFHRVIKREEDDQGNRKYDALDPNPFRNLEWLSDVRALYSDGTAVSGRFSPFLGSDSVPVPALYLAPIPETAYFEVILRPSAKGVIALQKSEVAKLEIARVSFKKPLKLADCRKCYLQDGSQPFWDYTFDQLFEAAQMKCLDNARSLAKFIHDSYPDIDGLVWDSVQHGNLVPVYMIFGERRDGMIEATANALSDIAVWKPYLLNCIADKTVVVSTDIAALL